MDNFLPTYVVAWCIHQRLSSAPIGPRVKLDPCDTEDPHPESRDFPEGDVWGANPMRAPMEYAPFDTTSRGLLRFIVNPDEYVRGGTNEARRKSDVSSNLENPWPCMNPWDRFSSRDFPEHFHSECRFSRPEDPLISGATLLPITFSGSKKIHPELGRTKSPLSSLGPTPMR